MVRRHVFLSFVIKLIVFSIFNQLSNQIGVIPYNSINNSKWFTPMSHNIFDRHYEG